MTTHYLTNTARLAAALVAAALLVQSGCAAEDDLPDDLNGESADLFSETLTVREHFHNILVGRAFERTTGSIGLVYSADDSRIGGTPFALREGDVAIIQCPNFGCNMDDEDIAGAAIAMDCGLGATDILARDHILSFRNADLANALLSGGELGAKSEDGNTMTGLRYHVWSDGWIDLCQGTRFPNPSRIFLR
ncbi:MAG: hypothetical protein AAGC55_06120 [Myxococcota bacterium]